MQAATYLAGAPNTIAQPLVYTTRISFTLNGRDTELEVPNHHLLLETLRRTLDLTGTTDSCGIGPPGQIMSAKALLAENPRPSADEIKAWMMGNLCRCTGYYAILESIQAAAAALAPRAQC